MVDSPNTVTGERHGHSALSNRVFWSLVAMGIAIRLAYFVAPRTLWLDEAMVAINLRESWGFLIQGQLFYQQRAPLGWLLLEKGLFDLAGSSALALRLPALAAGIAAFVLLADTARRWLSKIPATGVLAIMAMAPLTIRYCAEVKHYAFDLLAASTLAWFLVAGRGWRFSSQVIALNAVCVVASFLSFPFVFWAVAVALAIATEAADVPNRLRRLGLLSLWVPVFAASFLWASTRFHAEETLALKTYWEEAFWPLFPPSMSSVTWPLQLVLDLNSEVVGFSITAVVAIVLIAIAAGFSLANRDRIGLAMLGVWVLALGANGAGLYPLTGRFALFLFPSIFLLLGFGLDRIAGAHRLGRYASVGILLIMVIAAFLNLARSVNRRPGFEDLHQGISIALSQNPGNSVYAFTLQTIPAYSFHYGEEPIDPRVVWLEYREPLSPHLAVEENASFLRARDPKWGFKERDPAGRWIPSRVFLDFIESRHREGRNVILVATHWPTATLEMAKNMPDGYEPSQVHDFHGGVVIVFAPDRASAVAAPFASH